MHLVPKRPIEPDPGAFLADYFPEPIVLEPMDLEVRELRCARCLLLGAVVASLLIAIGVVLRTGLPVMP